MNIKEFLDKTLGKWIKIEHGDMTIIQKVTSYYPFTTKTANKKIECSGYSISNAEGDVNELYQFYMTKSDLNGRISELTEEKAEQEIKIIKG